MTTSRSRSMRFGSGSCGMASLHADQAGSGLPCLLILSKNCLFPQSPFLSSLLQMRFARRSMTITIAEKPRTRAEESTGVCTRVVDADRERGSRIQHPPRANRANSVICCRLPPARPDARRPNRDELLVTLASRGRTTGDRD